MKWSRHGRVITADPGREFSFVTEEGGRESTLWRYRFEVVEGGTRVTESYEVKWIPSGPASWTFPRTDTASCTRPCVTRSSSSERRPRAPRGEALKRPIGSGTPDRHDRAPGGTPGQP